MEYLRPYDLGSFISLITNIHLSLWGNKLTFECVYDPIDRKPYKMIFIGCNSIRWDIYNFDKVDDTEADLIDIQLIQDAQQKKAIFCTDIFDITFVYESLEIEKAW